MQPTRSCNEAGYYRCHGIFAFDLTGKLPPIFNFTAVDNILHQLVEFKRFDCKYCFSPQLTLHRVTPFIQLKIRLIRLLPLKSICPASKVRSCGTSLVFLQYCKSESEKTLLNSGIAVPPKLWNKKTGRIQDMPKEYGDAKSLNEEVYRLYSIAEKMIQFALTDKIPDPILSKCAIALIINSF